MNKLTPMLINDRECYVEMMHPRALCILEVASARTRYHHERWVERYNRWRASRGEAPYIEIEAGTGTFTGVTFSGSV